MFQLFVNLFYIHILSISASIIIKIDLITTSSTALQIAEVEFFYLNNKLSSSLFSVTSSSQYGESGCINGIYCFPYPSYAIDGNYNSFFHSYMGGDQYLILSSNSYNDIDTIIVTNRPDCCQSRILSATIQLYNSTAVNNVKYWSRLIINFILTT